MFLWGRSQKIMPNLLYLASQSPRRADLLQQIGVKFETVNAPIEEVALPNESAHSFVQRMAIEKALSGFQKLAGQQIWVLGGDTLVKLDDQVLGKPRNEADGYKMLRLLSGKTHQVFSAIALVCDGVVHSKTSITKVTFKHLTDTEIKSYWASNEPKDKAGSYAIQGLGAKFVKSIEGSYSGVIGLPLYELEQLLIQTNFYTP